MKTKLTFFLLLFTSSLQLMFSQTWEYSNALESEWMRKICTQGLDTVYIVGRNGLIARSTDRSATWTKQYPITAQLNDIIFCNHTTGFTVGNNGTILRTTDAGASWTQQNSGVTVNLNAIAATGTDNIWAVGDSGIILNSIDNGKTWQTKDLLIDTKLNDITFSNNIGYIIGNSVTIYKTVNHGENWIKDHIEIQNDNNISTDLFNLLIVNQTDINHVSILYGLDYRGYNLNIDGNSKYVPDEYLTSFLMQNDSIGYGVFACMTSNGVNMMKIYKLKNGNYVNCSYVYPVDNQIDCSHSDIAIVNDTVGYLLSGNFLYKLTKGVVDNVNTFKYFPSLSFITNKTYLTLNSPSQKIQDVEVYNIFGSKVIKNYKLNTFYTEISTQTLATGIYIIRCIFSDKSESMTKWIKQ